MALTFKSSVMARAVKDFLDVQKGNLGVEQVFYGDQSVFPKVPAVCVEPAQLTRELSGMQYFTDNNFSIVILVYHTSLEGTENIQEVCDKVTDDVVDALNRESAPAQVGGGTMFGNIIISGMVRNVENGYRILNDRLMRCNRIIWTGFSKTHLLEA